MKIVFQLPPDGDADVQYDPRARTITVTPLFDRPGGLSQVAGVKVSGERGVSKRFTLTVSGRTGELTRVSCNRRVKRSQFDNMTSGSAAAAQLDVESEETEVDDGNLAGSELHEDLHGDENGGEDAGGPAGRLAGNSGRAAD